jgi:hypothetical protein
MAAFFGTGLLVLLTFAMIAGGIYLIQDGNAFNGVACLCGALVSAGCAVLIYKSQQKNV